MTATAASRFSPENPRRFLTDAALCRPVRGGFLEIGLTAGIGRIRARRNSLPAKPATGITR
jgi:hypothetical protein